MNKYKINLIIATYAGKYNSENKENILKLNLKILNELNPSSIEKITVMKPKINLNHEEIDGYYDFNNLNLNNIYNKIQIIECENIGISYGQFFTGIFHNIDYDYYILIEDDYVIFKKSFADEFIEEFSKNENDSLLCSFIYKKRNWDIISYAHTIGENHDNICLLNEKLMKYNMENIRCSIPDFSLTLLSKNTVLNIIKRFINLNNLLDIFNIELEKTWIHQILFGYIINASDIKIYDIANSHLNIFYHTSNTSISTCNFEDYVGNWKENIYQNEIFKSPLFIPIQILGNNKYADDLNHMKIYMEDETDFFEKYNKLILLCNYKIRKLEKNDYKNYLGIMFEFTNYKYDITIERFNNEIDEMEKVGLKEIIILEHNHEIIGAGTIFKLTKLHNNPIGQIEDVIITEKYRKLGLGKLIINKLVDIGINNMKCYKIILNCLDNNVEFYQKCGFDNVGNEMKYI